MQKIFTQKNNLEQLEIVYRFDHRCIVWGDCDKPKVFSV